MVKKDAKKAKFISDGLIAENRKARFSYTIEDTIEAGISLMGSEVKSLRAGRVNITEGFVVPNGNELFLENILIQEYKSGNISYNHQERRVRKLLMHKKEIAKYIGFYHKQRATIVPLKIYFTKKGLVKVLLGIGVSKNMADKRETIKRRDWKKQQGRIMRSKG